MQKKGKIEKIELEVDTIIFSSDITICQGVGIVSAVIIPKELHAEIKISLELDLFNNYNYEFIYYVSLIEPKSLKVSEGIYMT